MTKQYGHEDRYSGRFGDHIEPAEGFIYPEPGAFSFRKPSIPAPTQP